MYDDLDILSVLRIENVFGQVDWDVYEFFTSLSSQIIDLGVDVRFEQAGQHLFSRGVLPAGDALYENELEALLETLKLLKTSGTIAIDEAAKAPGMSLYTAVKTAAKTSSKTLKAGVGDKGEAGPKLDDEQLRTYAEKSTSQGTVGSGMLKSAAEIQSTRVALGRNLQTVDRVMGLLQGPSSWSEKLAKFRKAEGFEKVVTLADLVGTLSKIARDGLWLIADVGARLELLAPVAVRSTFWKNFRDKGVLKFASRALALLDLALSIERAWVAFRDGNARQQAEATHGLVQSGIYVFGEFGGATGEALSLPATGIAFLVWAEIDTIMMVAEIHRGFRKLQAMEVTRGFVTDAVKLAYIGQDIFDASVVLNETLGLNDPVSAAASERAARLIDAHMERFRKGCQALRSQLWNHESDSMGGYESANAFGADAYGILSYWADYGILNIFNVENDVRTVYAGVKAVAEDAAKRYKPDKD